MREKPGDKKEQEKYYSGKANKHTFKTQMIILPDASDIVDVVAGEPGSKSDITLFRENRDNFELTQKFQGDLGYLGEELIETPIKTPRNGKLTREQKKENQDFSSKRVFVEHHIRSVKTFRVIQERFRLNSQKYERVILTICGLVSGRKRRKSPHWNRVRFRIGALILPTKIEPLPSS